MNSETLLDRAKKVTPGGVHSPVRSFKGVGTDPIFFARGEGPYLYDVDGKRFIDFCASFGPHILGHTPRSVVEALTTQISQATSFGACHAQEVVLCELILKGYPFADQVRLVNSGTEAVMTALRIARGFTGRQKILKFEGCYHGHSDALLVKSGSGVAALSAASSKGIPPNTIRDTLVARYDDFTEIQSIVERDGSQIAAVILEPIPANHGLWIPPEGHVARIFTLAKNAGALVLFDEVITGFRLGLSGASGLLDLQPDLVTLGKVIGGGLPLAAIAGKKNLMEQLAPVGEVYQAGTLSGNPLATAAGIAVLQQLISSSPYAELETRTADFIEELETVLAKHFSVTIHHLGSLFWMQFDDKDKGFPPVLTDEAQKQFAQLHEKALQKGIYLAPSPYEVSFVSTAHTEAVLDEALENFRLCLK